MRLAQELGAQVQARLTEQHGDTQKQSPVTIERLNDPSGAALLGLPAREQPRTWVVAQTGHPAAGP